MIGLGIEFSLVIATFLFLWRRQLRERRISVSRITQSSGVSGGTDTSCAVPFTVSVMNADLRAFHSPSPSSLVLRS